VAAVLDAVRRAADPEELSGLAAALSAFRATPPVPSARACVPRVSGSVRRRYWVELTVGWVAVVLAVATTVWPDWIERWLGFDPDGANGALEGVIVGVLLLAAASLMLASRLEARRYRNARSDPYGGASSE
jgi:hypothetical protein